MSHDVVMSLAVGRFSVRQLSGVLHWGIFDEQLNGWCTLPTDNSKAPALVPLEWKTPEEALVWLYLCRRAWASRAVPAPEGWEDGAR